MKSINIGVSRIYNPCRSVHLCYRCCPLYLHYPCFSVHWPSLSTLQCRVAVVVRNWFSHYTVPNCTSPKCALTCSISRLVELQLQGTWRHVAGGGWWPTEILMSIDIIVWTLCYVRPLRHNLMMPHGHRVENCSLRLCRKGRLLYLGESRSPTQIVLQNLLPTSHW